MKCSSQCRHFLVLFTIPNEDVNAPSVGSGYSGAELLLLPVKLRGPMDVSVPESLEALMNVLSKHSLKQRLELWFPPPFAIQGLHRCGLPRGVSIPPCKLQESNFIRRNWATYPHYSNYQGRGN